MVPLLSDRKASKQIDQGLFWCTGAEYRELTNQNIQQTINQINHQPLENIILLEQSQQFNQIRKE